LSIANCLLPIDECLFQAKFAVQNKQ